MLQQGNYICAYGSHLELNFVYTLIANQIGIGVLIKKKKIGIGVGFSQINQVMFCKSTLNRYVFGGIVTDADILKLCL